MNPSSDPIVVVDYDPTWPALFAALRAPVAAALGDLAVAVEHVGSTAVPGLAAKPVVDMDVAIPSASALDAAIERLASLCYVHKGDQGILGRAAFDWPPHVRRHHLYVCAHDNAEYRRHLLFRDYLHAHPDVVAAYTALKRHLAARYRTQRETYTDAKGPFIGDVLARAEEWARAIGWTAADSNDLIRGMIKP